MRTLPRKFLAPMVAVALLALHAAPATAQLVIDPFGGGFAFGTFFSADNAGTPYWANESADRTFVGEACNFGFFATGTVSPTCSNALAGSFANSASFLANPYSWWYGSVQPFHFAPGPYQLSLVGGYHGLTSSIWTYYCVDDACFLGDDLASFGAGVVGSSYHVSYGGFGATSWGLFYQNGFNTSAGCDSGLYCSGLNDGTALPGAGSAPQFWAIAESNERCAWGTYCYLVGLEDNTLDYLDNNLLYRDADYNDYLITVTATPEPATMSLLALGLVGLSAASVARRRRRNG